jgi:hypothetical protein
LEEEDGEGEGISSTRDRLDLNRKLFFLVIDRRREKMREMKNGATTTRKLSPVVIFLAFVLSRALMFSVSSLLLSPLFSWDGLLSSVIVLSPVLLSTVFWVLHSFLFFDILKTPREDICIELREKKMKRKTDSIHLSLIQRYSTGYL